MNKPQNIIGIGTDILAIHRFKSSVDKYGEKFLNKIFTRNEIEYCNTFSDPIPRFAARFCAKESVVKALGEGFGETLSFHDIEIHKNEKGKPFVSLSDKANKHFDSPSFELSLSHCKEYATATVIALT